MEKHFTDSLIGRTVFCIVIGSLVLIIGRDGYAEHYCGKTIIQQLQVKEAVSRIIENKEHIVYRYSNQFASFSLFVNDFFKYTNPVISYLPISKEAFGKRPEVSLTGASLDILRFVKEYDFPWSASSAVTSINCLLELGFIQTKATDNSRSPYEITKKGLDYLTELKK